MRRKPDQAHVLTDQELAELEKRIAAEYKKASKELQEKIDAYFARFKERDAAELKKLKDGKINEQQYKQWRLAQIGRGKRFEALQDRVAERMTAANEVAAAYINDRTPGIYSLNRNYAAYTIEQQVGADVGFDLWDEQTVRRLIVEKPDLMPYYPPKRAVKRGIDLAWGKRQITAQVTAGILQGESIKHLADRLQTNIPTMNRDSAIRAARTAVTGAQNAGRMDSYFRAEEMGIRLQKEWLATLDGRTRHTHRILDGQRRESDKPFEVDGYEIMFPGDPNAPGHLVYNCRCTLIASVDGVDTSNSLRRDRYGTLSNMTFAQWENTKRGEGALAAERYARKESEREARDKKQYAEYKAILGKEMPSSFAAFQDLKYNAPDKWADLKAMRRKEIKILMEIKIIDNSGLAKEEMLEACLRALEECGMVGEGYAKLLCPVDTGNLRNSITYLVVAGTLKVYIGTNSEYGSYVELGTGIYYAGGRKDPWVYQDAKGQWHLTHGQRAQPYLKPAVADHAQQYKSIIQGELKG